MKTNTCNSNLPGLILMVALVMALLASCSGGNIDVTFDGTNLPPGTVPPFQNTEPVTAYGTVNGSGDLRINGVQYSADAASITIDSQPGTLSDLKAGHVVLVTGRISLMGVTGRAETVRSDSRVIGPVDAVDAPNGRLTVMGQTIRLGADTRYPPTIDPDTLNGLAAGQIARISGYADAGGAVRATRVEIAHTGSPLQLVGKVDGLDIGKLTFSINQMTVSYGSAVLVDLPGGGPGNGMVVKAIGHLSNGRFAAEQLLTAAEASGSNGQRVQLTGLITRFDSRASFEIGGISAATNAATTFANGSAGDLAINASITIDGEFANGGRILAHRLTFGRLAPVTTRLAYDLNGFTEISIPTVFGITVTQGAEYSVEVFVDEEEAHRVRVSQDGSRLTIALQSGNGSIETLDAVVTMPYLDKIDLTGTVFARLRDFDQAQMTMNIGGVSLLVGDALRIGHLYATVSGVSQLDLGDILPIDEVDIDIGGVSQATLNMGVGARLTGSVLTGLGTGVSTLFYYGTNVITNITTGPLAAVVWLGDTRP